MRIAHITDCHVVADGELLADRVDSAERLARSVDRIRQLDPLPHLVVATGDLANDGRADEYDRLEALLAPLDLPLLPIPGNHDDRSELRRRFAVLPDGEPSDPIDHVVAVDGRPRCRLIALDTTIPGEHHGVLHDEQLIWLDDTLGEQPDEPTIIVQHHPPFLSGIPWMDRFALSSIDAEVDVLRRHSNVLAVLCGHYHRPSAVQLAGTVAWCAPSSAAQVDLHAANVTYTSENVGFAVHDLSADGSLRTHLVVADDVDRWRPAWSLAADA